MKQLRIELACAELDDRAAVGLVRQALTDAGITTYRRCAATPRPGCYTVVLDDVTVVYQYDIQRDEFTACGLVDVPDDEQVASHAEPS